MLVDRKILIEKEISLLQKESAELYWQIAVVGQVALSESYSSRLEKLASLRDDLEAVNHLISTNRENLQE